MFRMALLCVLLAAPSAAVAQDRDKGRSGDTVDRLARKLEREAHDLHEEVIVHFRKSHVKDLNRHAREIEKLAGRIHKLSDEKARPRLIRETLDLIDEEVRHLDRHVRDLAREKEIDRRAYDHLRDELVAVGRTLYRIRRELH